MALYVVRHQHAFFRIERGNMRSRGHGCLAACAAGSILLASSLSPSAFKRRWSRLRHQGWARLRTDCGE